MKEYEVTWSIALKKVVTAENAVEAREIVSTPTFRAFSLDMLQLHDCEIVGGSCKITYVKEI